MQIKSIALILPLLLTSFWFAGCTKKADGITGPVGPAGPPGISPGSTIKSNDITGYIHLFDEFGNADSSSLGVTVSTLKGDSLKSAQTDANGKFTLPLLPPGNYDIHVTKPGFDSLKIFVQHSGGDEAKFIGVTRLEASLTNKITSGTISLQKDVFNDNLLVLTITFTGPPSTLKASRGFNFYFSRSGNLTSAKFDVMTTSPNQNTQTNQYQLQYDLTNITNAGIHYSPGDTVYVKTCASPPGNFQTVWFDFATYQSVIYPYLGDSIVNHFVWPN